MANSTVVAMLAWLRGLQGNRVISIQHLGGKSADRTAINAIQATTGKWVGGIGGDLYDNNGNGPIGYQCIPLIIEWWNNGGIATINAGIPNPYTGGSALDTSMDWNQLMTQGTATWNRWHQTMDEIAAGMQQLKDAGVVVMWRPLHEMNGTWNWWSGRSLGGTANYKTLWQQMWNYFTTTKGLDNIIWVYSSNGGDLSYYPGDTYVDIVGFDAYTSNPAGDGGSSYNAMQSTNKLMAYCEFGPNSPSAGDTNFNEQTLINALKNNMPKCIYFEQWWERWGIDRVSNTAAALSDPYVLNRDNLGRPTSATPLPPSTTESPDKLDITTVGPSITDATGNSWAINSAGQVVINGVPDTTTGGVVELAYVSRLVWQKNSSGLWWSKTSPAAAWLPSDGTSVSPFTGTAPSTPVLSIGSITTNSVALSWTASTSGTAVTYLPQFKLTSDTAWTSAASPAGTSTTIAGLLFSTSYDFRVIASNSAASTTSATRTAVTASASGTVPTPPSGLSSSNIAGGIRLSWLPSSGTGPITYQPQFQVHTTVITPPPPPPAPTESTKGATISTVGPSLVNRYLEVYTLVASANGLAIAVDGVTDTTTANVALVLYWDQVMYHQNTAGNWYSEANKAAVWASVPQDPRTPAPTPTGRFYISGGEIIDPDGKIWRKGGLNIYDYHLASAGTSAALTPFLSLFPGSGVVRVPCYSYDNQYDSVNSTSLNNFINWCAAKKILVIIEDHTGISATPYTGSALQAELNFYSGHATKQKNNPYFAIGTFNEPGGQLGIAGVVAQHKAIYDAVRATGSNCLIFMCLLGGGNPGTIGTAGGMTPATYANMTNIVWEFHYYGWQTKPSTDQAVVNAGLIGSVSGARGTAAAQSIRSADGLVPVFIGEFGPSSEGNIRDANGFQVVKAVIDSGLPFAAWNWDSDAADDNVTDGNGNLTDFGRMVAAGIAAKPAGTVVTPPAPIVTSPDQTTIQAGSSALITASDGTKWGIIGDQVSVNGVADSTTSGVILIAYVGGLVWQNNSAGLWWSKSTPTDSWSPSSGTTVSPLATAAPPTGVTRTPWDHPGGANSVINVPLGDGCIWGNVNDPDTIDIRRGWNGSSYTNGPVGIINPPDNFGSVYYVGKATDAQYTINCVGNNGRTKVRNSSLSDSGSTITAVLHVPTGATSPGPFGGGDNAIVMYDPVNYPTRQYTWGSLPVNSPGFQPGQGPFNAGQGEWDDATSDQFMEDADTGLSGYNIGAGLITGYDTDPARNPAYPMIRHGFRYATDARLLKENGITPRQQELKPDSWPQRLQDGQGDPNSLNYYRGNLVAGTTLGIPMSTPMPSGLNANQQGLFKSMQRYGSFFRDQAGGGFHYQCDHVASASQWMADARAILPQLVALLRPLRNQHQYGQSFTTFPKNGPGNRLDQGPPPLSLTAPPVTPPSGTGTLVTSPLTGSVTTGTWSILTYQGMTYGLLLPAQYDNTKKYPLILYMHQFSAGSFGWSGLGPQIDPWFNTVAFRTARPCIILAPLCNQGDPQSSNINWGGVDGGQQTYQNLAIALTKQTIANYPVYASKVYMTGNSMGAIGCWDDIIKYNRVTGTIDKIFSAALILAGATYSHGAPGSSAGVPPDNSVINALKTVPIYAIHGSSDTNVPLAFDRAMYSAIGTPAGGKMQYTEDGSLGHDVWDTYYPRASTWTWLFNQTL